MNKAFIIFLVCCLTVAMAACGGSNSTIIIISPSLVTLPVGQSQQFTANLPVTWTASGDGMINSAGLFTAGATPGTATVTGTASDGKSNDSVSVTVVAAGTNTTTTTTGASGIKHRVFVSNSYAGTLNNGVLNIVDADNDTLSLSVVSVNGSPTFMVQSTDQQAVVVFDFDSTTNHNMLRLVGDSTEALAANVTLPGPTTSVLLAPGDLVAYTAIPSAAVASGVTGAVYVVQFGGSAPLTPIAVQGAQTMVSGTITTISPAVNNFLVFSQNCDTVTALQNMSSSLTTLTALGTVNGGTVCPSNDASGTFSRPVSAVFSAGGSTAYVLSSGFANGGVIGGGAAAPGAVTQLTMPTGASLPSPGTVLTLATGAAQVGLLTSDGTTLYVAGENQNNLGTGFLNVIDTSSMTVVASGSLGPGIPNVMACEQDSAGNCPSGAKIWIGSKGNCTINTVSGITQPPGCLFVYNPGSKQVTPNTPPQAFAGQSIPDDITGMVWLNHLNGRRVMYVVEGSSLQIYTTDTAPLAPVYPPPVDIVGQAVDVKAAF